MMARTRRACSGGKKQTIHHFIQNAIISAINDPSFNFALPELQQSTWHGLIMPSNTGDELERLEFVGDALMHACVGLELYKQFPQGSPKLYTNLRTALNTNATFTHFMVRAGTFDMTAAPGKSKVAADAFETLIAAYYFENGFNALCTWVASILKPLIVVAQKAYTDFNNNQYNLSKGQKRIRRMDSTERYGYKMARTSSLPRSSFRPNRTMYKPRNAIYPDIKTPRVFLSKIPSGDAGSSLRSHHAEIIDLTADSDSDGEWVDCDDSIRKFIPGPHYTVKKLPPRSMVSSLYPPPPLLPPPPFPPPSQPDNLLINDVSQSVVSANGSASALPSAFAISRDVTSGYAKGNDLYSTQVTGLVVISETASPSNGQAHLTASGGPSSSSLATSTLATPYGQLGNSNSALSTRLQFVPGQDKPSSLHPITGPDSLQAGPLASKSGLSLGATMTSSPVWGGPDNPICIDDDDIDMAH